MHRRVFLASSVGAAGLALLRARPADAAQQDVPGWMKAPGQGLRPYGERSPYESKVQRIVAAVPGTTGSGSSRAPLEHFEGIITPSALHFERHHSGVPDIPPGEHRLLIHGLVERQLTFDLASLSRYPLVSRIHFIECSGNSAGLYAGDPPQGGAGALHGLLSCSAWTGVPLSTLLEEVGVRPAGKWLLAGVMRNPNPEAKERNLLLFVTAEAAEKTPVGKAMTLGLILPTAEAAALPVAEKLDATPVPVEKF